MPNANAGDPGAEADSRQCVVFFERSHCVIIFCAGASLEERRGVSLWAALWSLTSCPAEVGLGFTRSKLALLPRRSKVSFISRIVTMLHGYRGWNQCQKMMKSIEEVEAEKAGSALSAANPFVGA